MDGYPLNTAQQLMCEWLSQHRKSILEMWFAKGKDFPFFAALRHRQLRATVAREFDGLVSFIGSDASGLEGVTETHKSHAEDFLRGAPVDQQLSFLESRIAVCTDTLDSDPEAAGFKDELIEKIDYAGRYYKTVVRSIDFEQRFSELA